MEGIKIYKRPLLKNPCLVVAWPGMGEVAFKAATYLVSELKAERFASIISEDFFYLTGASVEAGTLGLPVLPSGDFYYWKNPAARKSGPGHSFGLRLQESDLIIFISNAQPDLAKADAYCERIIEVAKSLKVKMVIGFAAMPQPIEHNQEPGVWFTGTSKEINDELKKYKLNLLSAGQISGMNGLFLGAAKQAGLPGFCLLGEIPLYTIQIDNPRASHAVLEALSRILNMRINLSGLIDQAHMIEGEIDKLLDYLKAGYQSQASAPIGEEEIERIKRSLSQLTRLPLSVKERIEKLFELSKSDVHKANELKLELDKWNVYKEYEDRFLDLFRKPKDKGN